MAKSSDNRMIVGLDIGTSKVVAVVGDVDDTGQVEIIGIGSHPSRGLKKGVVVNIDSTVQSIQRAIEEAELMAGCQINSVYSGIAGSHIRSLNSHVIVAIKDREVNSSDVERVIDAAKAVAIPADQRILHVLPQEFVIDDQEGVREPVGMSGVRLEAKVHLVTGAVNAAQNIIKCVKRCGLQVDDIILEQLASSQSVLTEDEKDLGVCVADIGGGTTDIAVFTEGAIRHTAVIPIAGDQVTNDIARRSGFEELIAAGVVLTGGSAKMEGVVELAEEVFHMPVRLGMPQFVSGLADVVRNPIHATGVGLLLVGLQNRLTREELSENRQVGIWQRVKHWFQRNF
jgi:cell division protein FtsA